VDIHSRQENGYVIVSPHQDIDLEVSGEFERVLLQAAPTGQEKIILDWAKVAYVDSSGIGAIVRIHRHLKDRGGELILAGCNENLLKIFKLINFQKYFRIFPSANEATTKG